MKGYRMIEFPQLGDDRGSLVVVEQLKEIPFDLKRIFYIYGTKENVVRGQHANRKSEFVLINLKGTCKVMVDDGKNKEVIVLDKPHSGIYLDKMVWKDMYDFSEDSILLVLSSELYDKSEYVSDYDQFIQEVNEMEIGTER
jgi:dTDP-4-dehydrorhamnose 3,5-epimerase-like enzyme